MKRCPWANTSLSEIAYHDKEWGVPIHDERKLFEFLILEGAQAGLSWETVLKKRENYRKAYHKFDPVKIAMYGQEDIHRLLANEGIIRNRLKIQASIVNARKFLDVQKEFGSFDTYIWQFTRGTPLNNKFKFVTDIPAKTKESELMSKNLQKRGFKFVGPTICYAFMQAVGMVNDHVIECFRYNA